MGTNWKLTTHYNAKRNEGCMQRTANQKQQKQAEQSDSWPSHKPQLPTRRNLVSLDFLFKNNQQLLVAGALFTGTRSHKFIFFKQQIYIYYFS